jgi:hypothetical protein
MFHLPPHVLRSCVMPYLSLRDRAVFTQTCKAATLVPCERTLSEYDVIQRGRAQTQALLDSISCMLVSMEAAPAAAIDLRACLTRCAVGHGFYYLIGRRGTAYVRGRVVPHLIRAIALRCMHATPPPQQQQSPRQCTTQKQQRQHRRGLLQRALQRLAHHDTLYEVMHLVDI